MASHEETEALTTSSFQNVRPSAALLESPETEQETIPKEVAPAWGPGKRILFRFLFSYFFLYIFPFPFDFIPFVDLLAQKYSELWQKFVPWVGKHVFGTEITVFPNGSGDTTFNYVQIVCFAVLAAIATVVWTLLDRKRPNYAWLHEWLRSYVRLTLAIAMITYGAYKIFPSQFPSPPLDRLLQPFGDASPMGMLWTFMGSSAAYTVFSGLAEMVGGLLLAARRTRLLGALVSMGVLINIVMLNFCYDVPVKLYSAHLLAMAVFLIVPDLRRLANLFWFNRRVEPVEVRQLFRRKWLHRTALVLRTVFVLTIAVWITFQSYQGYRGWEDRVAKTRSYGIWNVERLEVDGQVRPPLITDANRWRRVIFSHPTMFVVQLMSDSRQRYALERDDKKRLLKLTKRDDPNWKATLSYRQLGPKVLLLEGTLDGKKIRAQLHQAEASDFRLTSRGFHWINEWPFNR